MARNGQGSTSTPDGARRRIPLIVNMRGRGGGLVGKLVLSAALVMAAAGIVGVGTFAVFTNTASVSQATSSGTITLNPINTTAPNNRLSIGATNIAAGDTIQRAVHVKNSGNIALSSVTLTTTASTSSLLDTT